MTSGNEAFVNVFQGVETVPGLEHRVMINQDIIDKEGCTVPATSLELGSSDK